MADARVELNLKNIWGKVVLYLKENRFVALHVACGNITDIAIEGNSLKVFSEDSTMRQILHEGRREIERALSWQGLDYNVEIVEKVIPPTPEEEDIRTLKTIFGNKLIIK